MRFEICLLRICPLSCDLICVWFCDILLNCHWLNLIEIVVLKPDLLWYWKHSQIHTHTLLESLRAFTWLTEPRTIVILEINTSVISRVHASSRNLTILFPESHTSWNIKVVVACLYTYQCSSRSALCWVVSLHSHRLAPRSSFAFRVCSSSTTWVRLDSETV